MFIYTRLSAPKRFAKFGCQTRTICHKENEKKRLPNSSPTDYMATEIFVRPVTAMISHRNVRHTILNPSELHYWCQSHEKVVKMSRKYTFVLYHFHSFFFRHRENGSWECREEAVKRPWKCRESFRLLNLSWKYVIYIYIYVVKLSWNCCENIFSSLKLFDKKVVNNYSFLTTSWK